MPLPLFISCREGSFSETNPRVYTATCMTIRSVLRAVASLSYGSVDLVASEGNALPGWGALVRLGQLCPSKGPVLMQRDEFPPNLILGNSPAASLQRFAVALNHLTLGRMDAYVRQPRGQSRNAGECAILKNRRSGPTAVQSTIGFLSYERYVRWHIAHSLRCCHSQPATAYLGSALVASLRPSYTGAR
jgi:hypothetical protein